MVIISARSDGGPVGLGSFVALFEEGPYYLKKIPVGLVELCVRAFGYHTIFDTVTVKKNSVPRRSFTLQPDDPPSQPYPDCDRSIRTVYVPAIDTAGPPILGGDALPIWEGVLAYYRRAIRFTEGDYVQATTHITGTSGDTIGPSLIAVHPGREVGPTSEVLEWLPTLTTRGLAETACEQMDATRCPQERMTTFLSFAEPRRLHGDTVEVSVHETGVNPSACRKAGGAFMGFDNRAFVLALVDGGWNVIGRSPALTMSGSGYCGPEN